MEGKQKHIMKKISNVPTGVSVAFIQRSYADSQRSFSSIQFSHSVVSDSLWPHESQHTRPPCPSPTPGIYPNSRPLSWWCHPTISSSVVPFSSCLQSFPTSGSFQMSQLFASGGPCVMSRIILWAEDKTCRGEGSRSGAQIGETVGSGSRWRKRLRGSYTTLQAETEITTTLCNPEWNCTALKPHMVS